MKLRPYNKGEPGGYSSATEGCPHAPTHSLSIIGNFRLWFVVGGLQRIEKASEGEGRLDLSTADIQYIVKKAALNCHGLTELILPPTVESIEDEAFKGCQDLKLVVFPQNLSAIGDEAFAGCSALRTIVFLSHYSMTFGRGVFSELRSALTICIPFYWPNTERWGLNERMEFVVCFYHKLNADDWIYRPPLCFPSFKSVPSVANILDSHARKANRGLVLCVLLCAHRIENLFNQSGFRHNAKSALTRMPLEMWFAILERVCWQIVRANPGCKVSASRVMLDNSLSPNPASQADATLEEYHGLTGKFARFFEEARQEVAEPIAGVVASARGGV